MVYSEVCSVQGRNKRAGKSWGPPFGQPTALRNSDPCLPQARATRLSATPHGSLGWLLNLCPPAPRGSPKPSRLSPLSTDGLSIKLGSHLAPLCLSVPVYRMTQGCHSLPACLPCCDKGRRLGGIKRHMCYLTVLWVRCPTHASWATIPVTGAGSFWRLQGSLCFQRTPVLHGSRPPFCTFKARKLASVSPLFHGQFSL